MKAIKVLWVNAEPFLSTCLSFAGDSWSSWEAWPQRTTCKKIFIYFIFFFLHHFSHLPPSTGSFISVSHQQHSEKQLPDAVVCVATEMSSNFKWIEMFHPFCSSHKCILIYLLVYFYFYKQLWEIVSLFWGRKSKKCHWQTRMHFLKFFNLIFFLNII